MLMKQVKKLLCGVLMVCMILTGITVAPQNVQAAKASGNDGEIHWEIKGDTLTISAVKGTKGRMRNFFKTVTKNDETTGKSYQTSEMDRIPPWLNSSSSSKVKNVVIKEGVTELQSYAIYDISMSGWSFLKKSKLQSLDSITVAGSIKTIPSWFFLGKVETVILCEGVENFDSEYGLCFPSSTRNVYMPKTLKEIPYYAIGGTADCYNCGLQKVYGYTNSTASKYVDTCNEYDEISKTDVLPDGNMLGIYNGTSDNKIKFVALDKSSSLSKAKATSSISLKKGKSQTIKVTLPTGFTKVAKYTSNPVDVKVTFKSSNKNVATVSSSGKVTGKKKGTSKITVTMQIKDGAKKTVTTKVNVK